VSFSARRQLFREPPRIAALLQAMNDVISPNAPPEGFAELQQQLKSIAADLAAASACRPGNRPGMSANASLIDRNPSRVIIAEQLGGGASARSFSKYKHSAGSGRGQNSKAVGGVLVPTALPRIVVLEDSHCRPPVRTKESGPRPAPQVRDHTNYALLRAFNARGLLWFRGRLVWTLRIGDPQRGR
jgi:hypothetical protein